MTRRFLSIVLVLGVTGCPSDDTGETDPDSSTSGTEVEGTNDTDVEGTDDTDVEGTDDTDVEGTDDTDVEGTDPPTSCHVLDPLLPDWAGDFTDPTLVTDVPFAVDAGLGPVRTAALATVDGPQTVDLQVTGAIVTTLDFNRDADEIPPVILRFWVGDSTGGMKVFLDSEGMGWDVVPGDQVDFTVNSVNLVDGVPEISGISALTVVSEGNAVFVKPGNGVALDLTNDIGVVHQLYGELIDGGTACPSPNTCFDLETVSGNDSTVAIVRLRNDRLQTALVEGDCVQVQAPLESVNGEPQFNMGNLQWHRLYGNIND